MQKIRGLTQFKPGTLPYAAVDSAFTGELLAKKAIADFVEVYDKVAVPGDPSVSLGALLSGTMTHTPSADGLVSLTNSDFGFIATPSGTSLIQRSRVIVRDAANGNAVFDAQDREIYGYLIDISGGNSRVDLYIYDGAAEVPAVVPAGVTLVDFQLLRRFDFASVGEDFAANEKWAMGIADTETLLNLDQLAKDIYGTGYSLDADGNPNLPEGVYETIVNHKNAAVDAHDATAISFSGTAGIVATNVQLAIEAVQANLEAMVTSGTGDNTALITAISGTLQGEIDTLTGSLSTLDAKVDNVSGTLQTELDALATLLSGTQSDLAHHIAALFTDADAHKAAQIGVTAFVASGTFALDATKSLQENMEAVVTKIYGVNSLIETHMIEDSAHRARNIDVEVSGTDLAAHFPGLVASGTIDLQAFLANFDTHVHATVDAVSGTLQAEIGTLSGIVTTLAQHVEDVSGTLQAQISAAVSGTVGDLSAELDALSGTLTSQINAVTTNLNLVSGTLQGEIDGLQTQITTLGSNLSSVSGTLQTEIDNLQTQINTNGSNISGLSGTVVALHTHLDSLLGVNGSDGLTFVGASVSGTTTVTSAVNALAAAIQAMGSVSASGTASEIARLEAAIGMEAGALDVAFSGTYVAEGSVKANVESLDAALVAHFNSTTAHTADHIVFVSGTTTINASDVQAAFANVGNRLNRLETEQVECEPIAVGSDGSGQIFTLTYAIKAGTAPLLIVNGLVQKLTVDYTIDALDRTKITILGNTYTDDEIFIWYKRTVA